MAGNSVVLEFAGDADKLAKEAQRASREVQTFGDAANDAAQDVAAANQTNDAYVSKLGSVGAGVDGFSTAVDDATVAMQAFADIQNASENYAQKMKRAVVAVKQAQEDYNQAIRDGEQAQLDAGQAAIDLEQAHLDEKTALKEYNEAVKEHGKNSDEAKQAQIDLKQAGQDVKQAQEDQKQALRDQEQAAIDAETAQLDLVDAQKEANPTDLQKSIDQMTAYAPLLSGIAAIIGLVTIAQLAWNLATLASPVTWIVLGIVALIAIVVLLIKNWDKVKEVAGKAWDWILEKGKSFWGWLKKIPGWIADAFSGIGKTIMNAFKGAFNWIADAWNNTIGSLSWSVPDWIPGIGGNTIQVPDIPRYHTGIDKVPGAPGSEMLAILQAGERVVPANQNSSGIPMNFTFVMDSEVIGRATGRYVQRNGGNAQVVLAGTNG